MVVRLTCSQEACPLSRAKDQVAAHSSLKHCMHMYDSGVHEEEDVSGFCLLAYGSGEVDGYGGARSGTHGDAEEGEILLSVRRGKVIRLRVGAWIWTSECRGACLQAWSGVSSVGR